MPGPLVDRLIEACKSAGIHAVMESRSVIRRVMVRCTTPWWLSALRVSFTTVTKVDPTAYERFWYGFGRGDDLDVISLPFARVGALIC